MTSQEVEASNTRAAALRTEGRRARSQVLTNADQYSTHTQSLRSNAVGIITDIVRTSHIVYCSYYICWHAIDILNTIHGTMPATA